MGEFIQLLPRGELHGLDLVDIHLPDHLKEYFEELPPTFKNTTVKSSELDRNIKQFYHAKTSFQVESQS